MSSLENALKIMLLLQPGHPVLRVGEVCRDLGIPKSSVSRLLKTLSEYGLLEREGSESGYVAGPRSLLLADLYSKQHSLKDQVDIALTRVTAEFGFAGYASVLNGSDIIILSVNHGTYPLRLVREIGQPMPAFTTSVGRALLAYLDDDEIVRRARAGIGDRYTDKVILERIKLVRDFGVAWGNSAIIPGIAALAVAIRDGARDEALGFSISYPTSAVGPELRIRMLRRLREEASAIGLRIRDSFWQGRNLDGWAVPNFPQDDLNE